MRRLPTGLGPKSAGAAPLSGEASGLPKPSTRPSLVPDVNPAAVGGRDGELAAVPIGADQIGLIVQGAVHAARDRVEGLQRPPAP